MKTTDCSKCNGNTEGCPVCNYTGVMAVVPATPKNMPKYDCYRPVSALKVKAVTDDGSGGKFAEFEPFDGHVFEPLSVSAGDWARICMIAENKPVQGGYLVFFTGTDFTWVPAEVFEEAYTLQQEYLAG